MKQKMLRITIVSCLLITSLFWGGTAYAQDEELPDPGLTPDSPFYFLDNWGKNIGMFFTFGDEAKAKKALKYAEERLAESEEDRVRAHDLHCAYYADFLHARFDDLMGGRQREATDEIEDEVENVRAAWQWAVERTKVDEIDRSTQALVLFYQGRSRYL